MTKITSCYCCDSTNLIECEHEDWDDEKQEEVILTGTQCLDCKTFQYEVESNVIRCIIGVERLKESNGDNVKDWLPEIN